MEVYIENTQNKIPVNRNLVTKLNETMNKAAEIHGLSSQEMSIIFVDNIQIQKINRDYRDKDQVTDVISFALNDDDTAFAWEKNNLGDIYISLERAKEQSIDYGHSFDREVCYLAVHGLLHLLGYDHINKDDKEKMREKEEEIMAEVGLMR